MRTFQQIWALASLFIRPNLRTPLWFVVISIIPATFVFIFWLIGGMALGQHALLGALVTFANGAGIVSLPQLMVGLKYRKLQDVFVASPCSPFSYAVGLALSRLMYVSPPLLLVLIILLSIGLVELTALPVILLILCVTWFTGTMIGFTVGTYVADNVLHVSAISNLLGLVLTLIPPVYYPLELIPESYRWLALSVPTANAAQLIRVASGVAVTSGWEVALHWTILGTYVVFSMFLSLRKSRWREV